MRALLFIFMITTSTNLFAAKSKLKVESQSYKIHISSSELEIEQAKFKVLCQASSRHLSFVGPLIVKDSEYISENLKLLPIAQQIEGFNSYEVQVPGFEMKVSGHKALWFRELDCYVGFVIDAQFILTHQKISGESSSAGPSLEKSDGYRFDQYNLEFNQFLEEDFNEIKIFSYRVEHFVGGGLEPIPFCSCQLELMFWSDIERIQKQISKEKKRDLQELCTDRWPVED